MKLSRTVAPLCTLLGVVLCSVAHAGDVPENFRRENLVAWAIVPYDAAKRSAAERCEMLLRLGMKRCAYDWRAEHVPAFEEEILQYQANGIEYVAFWSEHPEAFALFEKHGIAPQVWKTLRSPKGTTQEEKVTNAAGAMRPLAEKTRAMGCRLGLYNHGGWGGEPANLVAVCKRLNAEGYDHVGIVYNFHHAHEAIETFAGNLEKMKPYLLCLNLNGMVDPDRFDVKDHKNKIRPIGSAEFEKDMIRAIIDSGYEGPIGIIGHVADEDVEMVLRRNLDGLDRVLAEVLEGNAPSFP